MQTYDDSIALAHKLRKLSPAIVSIELFGSVLQNGRGRDIDFMILVDEELARRWWEKERESLRVRWPDALYGQRWIVKKFTPFLYSRIVYKRREQRLKFSADVLGISLSSLASPKGEIPDFEMFLVPAKWRIGTELNISVMEKITDLMCDKNTLGFFNRVASHAALVA